MARFVSSIRRAVAARVRLAFICRAAWPSLASRCCWSMPIPRARSVRRSLVPPKSNNYRPKRPWQSCSTMAVIRCQPTRFTCPLRSSGSRSSRPITRSPAYNSPSPELAGLKQGRRQSARAVPLERHRIRAPLDDAHPSQWLHTVAELRRLPRHEPAVKKLGQAPSLRQIFKGFPRFGSEPVPFFRSTKRAAYLDACRQLLGIADDVPPSTDGCFDDAQPSRPLCPRCEVVMECISQQSRLSWKKGLRARHLCRSLDLLADASHPCTPPPRTPGRSSGSAPGTC
jgi:hypothetical protein